MKHVFAMNLRYSHDFGKDRLGFKFQSMGKTISGLTGPKGRGPCKFTLTDLRRAMRAARKEDMPARIEIMPDGRISIIPMLEAEAVMIKGPTGPNEWDAVL